MTYMKQKYIVGGGLESTSSSGIANTEKFLQLVNCYTDKRSGMILKRGGSTSESLGASVNSPLGLGIYKSSTATLLMPVNIIYLAFFVGPTIYKKASGTWSSITLNANTSFTSTKQMQFAQLGTTMVMCGGRPARWDSTATQVERVGYPAPSVAATPSVGAATGLTGTYSYVYTYYNSVTGKESDWSPVSSTVTVANQKINVALPTTSPGSTADKKRLYRNANGGTAYLFVADVLIATASYVDSTSDASLGLQIRDAGKNALPPDSVFIVTAHKARFFMVDGNDPYTLKFSEGYTGNNNLVEYFPSGNSVTISHEITGLFSNPGSLLIFGIRSISLLSGSTEADFNIQPLYEGVGTLFPNSIAGNGDYVVFLAESGFKAISSKGLEHISGDIDITLRELLNQAYLNFIYVSATWNPALGQFLFAFSASTSGSTPWIISSSGSIAEWQLSGTGVSTTWTIPGSPSTSDLTRVKIWGWNPSMDEWMEYKFNQIADFNTSKSSINYLITPYPSTETFSPQQPASFFGLDLGAGNGKIVAGWNSKIGKDDSSVISATIISRKIQPGTEGNHYRFYRYLEFEGDYSDPSDTGATIQYIMDFDDPHIRDYTSNLYDFDGDGDKKRFTKGKGRYFYLKIEDDTDISNKVLLQNFYVYFIETSQEEGR